MATRRTTMRSKTGTKLYAVRDESGQFKDIQTYKRAHAADLRHKSKAEKEAAQGPDREEGQDRGQGRRQVRQEVDAQRGRCGGAGGEARGETGRRPAAAGETGGKEGRQEGRPQAPGEGRREEDRQGAREESARDGHPEARSNQGRQEGGEEQIGATNASLRDDEPAMPRIGPGEIAPAAVRGCRGADAPAGAQRAARCHRGALDTDRDGSACTTGRDSMP